MLLDFLEDSVALGQSLAILLELVSEVDSLFTVFFSW